MVDKIESLKQQLELVTEPQERVRLLLQIEENIRPTDPQHSLEFGEEAIRLAREASDKGQLAQALIQTALSNRLLDRYDIALQQANDALEHAQNPSETRAYGFCALGAIYHDLGVYDSALEYSLNSIKLARALDDQKILGQVLTNAACAYMGIKDAENALRFCMEGLEVCERTGEIQEISDAMSVLGGIYAHLGNNISRALHWFFRSLELRESIDSRHHGKGSILNNIGSAYAQSGRYTEGIRYFQQALDWGKQFESKRLCAISLHGIAQCYLRWQQDAKKALHYLQKALALESLSIDVELPICELCTECYKLLGDYETALKYHEKYLRLYKVIFREESDRKVLGLTVSYDVEKAKNAQILAQKEKEVALKEQEILKLKNEELSAALRKIQSLNAQLVRLNAEKNDVMDIVAHNLQNPLAGIRSITTVLIERHTSLEASTLVDQLHSIEQGSRAMLTTVTGLLDGHALDRGASPIRIERIDAVADTRSVIKLMSVGAEAKSVRIELSALPATQMAYADRSAVRQILENLLGNAIKFSPHNASIIISVNRSSTVVTIAIEDQGPGLTAQDQERLFTKYGRLSAQPTAGENSTGLGLWTAHTLAQQMQAHLWYKPSVNCGAIFGLDLPRATPKGSPDKA